MLSHKQMVTFSRMCLEYNKLGYSLSCFDKLFETTYSCKLRVTFSKESLQDSLDEISDTCIISEDGQSIGDSPWKE
jgi:hypothetical protein